MGQRFMMPRRQKQKARIWREIEWPLAQSEETFVHAYFHAFHAIAAAPTATPRSATPDAAITFQRRILRLVAASVTIGMAARTIMFSAERTSASVLSRLSRYSVNPASATPNAIA